MNQDQRFLMYRSINSGGHGYGYMHNLANLMALCTEAAHLGRGAILTPPEFDPAHNFGIPVKKQWNEYIDTKNIRVVSASGRDDTEHYIKLSIFTEDEISIRRFTSAETGVVLNTQNGDDQKIRDKPLLIRELTPEFNLWGMATPEIQNLYSVKVDPSEKVQEHALVVTGTLPSYIALHIRRGDRLKQNPLIDTYTQGEFIRDFIMAHCGPGSQNIFLMSDERTQGFFDILKTHFNLYSYLDYPSLMRLVSSPDPDNYMLFCIEKVIYYKASIRIGVFTDSDSVDYALSPYSMHHIHVSQIHKLRNSVGSLITSLGRIPFKIAKRVIRRAAHN